jgi:flagellar basal body-associated protein FliL
MKKLLPIIGVAVLALGAGGYLLVLPMVSGGGGKSAKKASAAKQHQLDEAKKRAAMKLRQKTRVAGSTVSLGDPLLVNLADPGLSHYVKVSISMAVDKDTPIAAAAADATTGPALENTAEIRDIVRSDIQEFTAGQLVTDAGQAKLKRQIVRDVSTQTDTLPLSVYFPDLAVQ